MLGAGNAATLHKSNDACIGNLHTKTKGLYLKALLAVCVRAVVDPLKEALKHD
jgi:hypothetical protein